MTKNESGRSSFIERIMQYEYELIIFIFLVLRFIFKNILGFQKYFTEKSIFNLSNKWSISIGSVVLLLVCIFLAVIFGRLIRKNGTEYEKPFIILVALFFACPATLPFLFDTKNVSGTILLYPFAIFALSIFLINKPFIKWLLPFFCALYFIPALYSSEIFFTALRKGAILYVPLILLYLYLDMKKSQIVPGKKETKYIFMKPVSAVLFYVSLLVSIGSYIFSLIKHAQYYLPFFNNEQWFDGYFAVCILIVSPALAALCAVLFFAVKNKFAISLFGILWWVSVLILLFRSNYYGLWIPFLLLSMFLIIFYGFWQGNSTMLLSVRTVGDYCIEHSYIFYIILISMASLSNVTSNFLSGTFQTLFNKIPF